MQRASTTALLAGVVDYAGLFPPAALSMTDAVAGYAAALAGPHAWMLGRFVVPAARLGELADALAAAGEHRGHLRVSAIVRDGSADDRAAVHAFNDRSAQQLAGVDSVECKPQAVDGVDWLVRSFGQGIDVYVEIAPGSGMGPMIASVATRGLRAKVRTGGVTFDAFPSPAALTALLAAVVGHGVRFKATAGLHHAVRGVYRLTYEPGAAEAPMYGYLNVLLAVAALVQGQPPAVAEALLQQTDAAALEFDADTVRWGARVFPLSILHDTRAHRMVSFGSCSFQEPVDEFDALASR